MGVPQTSPVTLPELSRAIDLHRSAYGTLMWLDTMSFAREDLLTSQTAATLRDPEGCRTWLLDHWNQIPVRLRPQAREDADVFGRMFASFFQTSFRVERRLYDGVPYYKIVAGADRAAGRDRLGVRRRVSPCMKRQRRDEARSLRWDALASLAESAAGHSRDRVEAAAERIASEPARRVDVLLWTYGWELVQRARGAAHGPSAHAIWKELDESTRRDLSAQRIWDARTRLVGAMALAMMEMEPDDDADD